MTSWLAHYGVAAIFVLMLIDAVFPAASELVMVYGGALASGALTHRVDVFGWHGSGFSAFLAVVLAGVVGYQVGAILGWWLGDRGGREFFERRGRWFHLTQDRLDKADRWFDRWDAWAVLIGRITPVARSFVSIPAGIFASPFGRYNLLTLARQRDLVPGPGRRRLGPRLELDDAPSRLPLRRDRRGGGNRGNRGVLGTSPSVATLRCLPPMSIPHVDVKAQYEPLIPQLQEAFARTLETGRFIFGPEVEAFEREAAELLGTQETVSCANGTDALVLVLDAMEIGPGDEVICPAFTFYATAEAIARRGATPVFADIDPVSLNLDPADVERRITAQTKAIMPVHLFGRPAADFSGFGLPVIEDAAQAFGAGGIATSIASTFSFFPTKNLFALGDGGLISVNDSELAQRIRMLRFHGSESKKEFLYVGYNSRLDAMQASFLRIFLQHIGDWNRQRREAAARYTELLDGLVETPVDERGSRLPHVLRPLARARPARCGARRMQTSASRSTTSRRCTCSLRCATSATPRATSRRRRRRRARISACRCGPGSPRSSRRRSSPS